MNDLETDRPLPEGFHQWLARAVDAEASDLHLVAGYGPMLRVHGAIRPIDEPPLDPANLRDVLMAVCPDEVVKQFFANKNADFSLQCYVGGEVRRFRGNYFLNSGQIGACFRVIPATIPDFPWAGFPLDVAHRLAHFRNGLVLATGVSGSGKTTTLAMLVDMLNQEGGYRIVTVEEPIEYVFPKNAGSVVTQREIGVDVLSFADGVKYALRQDPNVILVGEIRDRETAQMALSAAETGHLVFSTMHTRDAKGAISRLTDMFPQNVQGEIRAQLSMALKAVVSQHLLPSEASEKRELALEILLNNAPIASAIRFAKGETIDNYILTGRSQGMVTFDESIQKLYHAKRIRRETAERFISDPSRLPPR